MRPGAGSSAVSCSLPWAAALHCLPGAEDRFWVCVFSYERDYSRIVADLAAYAQASARSRPLLALVAAGKSQDCFLRSWESAGRPFPALALPFLAQETWDGFLAASDFSIIRGEDSWSRASLAGKPFLWQAYPQDGRPSHGQGRRPSWSALRPFFGAESLAAFAALEELYRAFNERERDGMGLGGGEALLPVLERYDQCLQGFSALSRALARNGDLAAGLVTFLRAKSCRIEHRSAPSKRLARTRT